MTVNGLQTRSGSGGEARSVGLVVRLADSCHIEGNSLIYRVR